MEESELGELRGAVKHLTGDIGEMKGVLLGLAAKLDGKDGVITQTALNKQSLSKAWKFIWLAISSSAGIAVAIIILHVSLKMFRTTWRELMDTMPPVK